MPTQLQKKVNFCLVCLEICAQSSKHFLCASTRILRDTDNRPRDKKWGVTTRVNSIEFFKTANQMKTTHSYLF